MSENRIDERENGEIDIFVLLNAAINGIKRLAIILIVVLVLISGTYTFYKNYTYSPLYQTKVTFSVIKKTDPTFYYNVDAAKQAQEVFSQVLKSELLYSIINDDLGTTSLPGYYSCTSVEETNLLVVSAYSGDAKMSYQLMNSFINNYDQVSNLIISDVRLSPIGKIVEPASPINAFSLVSIILKGIIFGLIIDIGLLVLDIVFRRTIQKEHDIKKTLNTQCIASISKIRKKKRTNQTSHTMLMGVDQLSSSFTEGLRLLRHRIESDARRHKNKVYVFSSTIPGEGKTTVSSNAAVALANNGNKVLLIDADLRKPSVYNTFNVQLKQTLNQVLDEECTLSNAITPYKDGLYLLANSEAIANPTEYLSSDVFGKIIKKLREEFDFIIIDTPPSSEMGDAAIVSEYADASIMVVRQDVAPTKKILEAMEMFVYNSHNLLGCVLNCTDNYSSHYGYHYYGNYGNRRS